MRRDRTHPEVSVTYEYEIDDYGEQILALGVFSDWGSGQNKKPTLLRVSAPEKLPLGKNISNPSHSSRTQIL